MRVSVVICTYNRADALRLTLDALRYQTFRDFEVVVVNGPSTDHTLDVLREWSKVIKTASNPEPNLSISRNLGIASSAGDLVAFIDDDAIPEFDWLADIVAAFEADDIGEVAGVGGLVFDHTGTRFQFRFAASSRLGEPKLSDTTPFDDLSIPGGFWFPYLQGTNAVFRRSVLEEVGGFDETFDYYLDETDLCARIVDAGYTLRQLNDAHVHHKFLASSIRNDNRIFTRWYPVIKNLTYFGYRHALDEVGEAAVLEKGRAELAYRVRESRMHERFGELPAGTAERVQAEGEQAVEDGRRLGQAAGAARLAPLAVAAAPFLAFPTFDRSTGRTYVLVTSTWGDGASGGIARFMSDVAPRLVRFGHEVRVVTTSTDNSRVDLESGLWMHRIDPLFGGALPGTSGSIDRFASGAATEVARISTFRAVDAVYGPAWDMEVLPIIRTTSLPVVAFLATPVAVTNHLVDTAQYHPDPYASLLLALEQEIFDSADMLHADSRSVVDVIAHRYARSLDPARVHVAHLGAPDRPLATPTAHDGDTHVLYVGRLEPRKGITDLLTAISLLAPANPALRFTIAGAENVGEGVVVAPWLRRHDGAEWLDRVRFTGAVDEATLDELETTADIAVIPSLYESFGLTVVEAMRRATAIVTTRAGAIPELVEHDREALLVPPRSPAVLATAIDLLARDPERRRRLGDAARRRYEAEFTIERAAERLNEMLGAVRHHPGPAARLGAGDGADLAIGCARAVRLVVRASHGTTVDVHGRRMAVAATPDGWLRRVDVPAATLHHDPLRVSVVEGTIEITGVVTIGEQSIGGKSGR
jgi:glycogen(starch) synthase